LAKHLDELFVLCKVGQYPFEGAHSRETVGSDDFSKVDLGHTTLGDALGQDVLWYNGHVAPS
jgi:hypothetical protein